MKESYIGKRALFVGNGINRTEKNNGVSWGDLLRNISETYGIKTDLTNDLKPFPLAFEEILYKKDGRNNIQNKLRNLKSRISEVLIDNANRLMDIEIHKGLMQCGIDEIITTNYDYNLQTSIFPDFINKKAEYSINNQESRHSLYRGYKINDVTVRQIHGELKHNRSITSSDSHYFEESIMIGFEHYSEYFAKIQSIIKGESGRRSEEERKSLVIRIRDGQIGKIWTDLFFTHQLIFAGFSLDFSENHLWWLLTKREDLKNSIAKNEVRINNEIIFCVPRVPIDVIEYTAMTKSDFNKLYKRQLDWQRNKAVADVLSSFRIHINEIPCNSYREFYQRVIDQYSVR